MGSERMPGKVMRKLSGIPALGHIFNILRESKQTDEFAVVTTVLAEDDVIERFCSEHSVKIIRGSVHDVLDRFRIASTVFNPARFVRVTGDDPLMDPEIIDKVISEHCEGNYDYTSNITERTYPRGMDTEVIERDVLEKVWRTTSDRDDHEHVTLFIRRNPLLYKIHNVKNSGENLSKYRLCMDTEEDYKLLSKIYDNLYANKVIRLETVIDFLKKNPELININSGVLQKEVKGVVY